MWERETIKKQAKNELKQSYWLSFAICLVASILGAGSAGTGFNIGSSSFNTTDLDFSNFNLDSGMAAIVMLILTGLVAFVILFAFVFSIFVSNPIETGKCGFFIRAPYGDRKFENLFFAFKKGRYIAIVKAMFMRNLYIFLWSLLFIIPGIIKAYQYRMVPYILSEDPTLSPNQAMDLSRRMTDGEKAAMFVLDLSFIGWYILGALACGVGVLFVNPYAEATWAQLYYLLRGKAA